MREEEEIPAGPYLIDEVSFHEKVPLSTLFLGKSHIVSIPVPAYSIQGIIIGQNINIAMRGFSVLRQHGGGGQNMIWRAPLFP